MAGTEGAATGPPSLWARVSALQAGREPFAVATVVARRAPVSAHLGDRAIVYADGRMEGFVGGACSREIVRRQALDALATRRARLVAIRPDADDDMGASADRIVVPMTCASEGAVDVYVEPVVRPRTLVVAGATPVAEALARLGRAMRYDVVRVVDGAERHDVEAEAAAIGATVTGLDTLEAVLSEALAHHGDCAVVVASQGHYDEAALETVLTHGVGYAGLVASRKRGQTVRAWLEERKAPGVDRLCNPAGLDLGGRAPEEVALSILGEIVQRSARGAAAADAAPAPERARTPGQPRVLAIAPTPSSTAVAIDPVCRMEVAMAGAAQTAEHDGVTYYFCCGGCRTRFLAEPARYLSATP
ncbi:MAG: XdhC family protein [Vicinamibacterales bacterium]